MTDASQLLADNDDDTSGHRLFSDRTVKEDVHPVDHSDRDGAVDDTAGHRMLSDRTVKEEVHPVDHGDEEGTRA